MEVRLYRHAADRERSTTTMPTIDELLTRVSKPARYTGGEWNSVTKDWRETAVHIALAYPDAYDIGMSNMGIGILYDILNKVDDIACERTFAPWEDMEAEIRREKVPLWSLETLPSRSGWARSAPSSPKL